MNTVVKPGKPFIFCFALFLFGGAYQGKALLGLRVCSISVLGEVIIYPGACVVEELRAKSAGLLKKGSKRLSLSKTRERPFFRVILGK